MQTTDKTLRILVVDDNRDGADALGLLIEELGNSPVPCGPEGSHFLPKGHRAESLAPIFLLGPNVDVPLQIGRGQFLHRESLAEGTLEMLQVHGHGGKTIFLHRSVLLGFKVFLLEDGEGYLLGCGRSRFRHLAIMQDEFVDRDAGGNGEQSLLEPQKQIIDFTDENVSLLTGYLADSDGVAFPLKAKLAVERLALFLNRSHMTPWLKRFLHAPVSRFSVTFCQTNGRMFANSLFLRAECNAALSF